MRFVWRRAEIHMNEFQRRFDGGGLLVPLDGSDGVGFVMPAPAAGAHAGDPPGGPDEAGALGHGPAAGGWCTI